MTSWVDVEFLVTHWYHDADRIVWCDLWALDSELDDLLSIEPTSAAERSILSWAVHDIAQQKADLMEELRPQLRLTTTDRWSHKSLRW
jgi:hypothetical protein